MGNTGNIICKFRNKSEIHYLDHGFFDPITHAPGCIDWRYRHKKTIR